MLCKTMKHFTHPYEARDEHEWESGLPASLGILACRNLPWFWNIALELLSNKTCLLRWIYQRSVSLWGTNTNPTGLGRAYLTQRISTDLLWDSLVKKCPAVKELYISNHNLSESIQSLLKISWESNEFLYTSSSLLHITCHYTKVAIFLSFIWWNQIVILNSTVKNNHVFHCVIIMLTQIHWWYKDARYNIVLVFFPTICKEKALHATR